MNPKIGRSSVLTSVTALLLTLLPSAHSAPPRVFTTPNLPFVGSVPFEGGSDLEFQDRITPDGLRSYLFAGSLSDYGEDTGLRIVDITEPTSPQLKSFLPCSTNQNDLQIMERGDRTFVILGLDYVGRGRSANDCFAQLGIDPKALGVVIIDATDVEAPRAVSILRLPNGAHNTTLHPAGRYLYVSDSEIAGSYGNVTSVARIQVVDLLDPLAPVFATEFDLPPGGSSHDITFSADGSRAYSAALTQTVILDTSAPATPTFVSVIEDPSINIHHQSDPFAKNGREYLIITDEIAGAAGNGSCPGGGLHVYDITNEIAPVKIGFFVVPDVSVYGIDNRFRCTAHVLRIYPESNLLTIAWYEAGSWVLDISDPSNIKAIQRAYHPVSGVTDAWSAKLWHGYLYTTDLSLGVQIFDYRNPRAASPLIEIPDEPAGAVSFQPSGTPSKSQPLFCFRLPGEEIEIR